MDQKFKVGIAVTVALAVVAFFGAQLFGFNFVSQEVNVAAEAPIEEPTATTTPTVPAAAVPVEPKPAGPQPPQVNFSANPRIINRGESTTLIWSTDAERCDTANYAGGSENGPSNGSVVVSPKNSSFYAIRCYNGGAYTEVIITVVVNQ